MSRYGKARRIVKTYVIPVGLGLGVCYGVVQLVGTPSQNYRRLQLKNSENREMDYFDKEIQRAVQHIASDGKSPVSYWHQYAKDRAEAEKAKRKRIRELIKEGKSSQQEIVSELKKIDNSVIQDSLDMLPALDDDNTKSDDEVVVTDTKKS